MCCSAGSDDNPAVIDASILAAIEARLAGALSLPPAVRYRPFWIDGAVFGFIDDDRVARLAAFPQFRAGPDGVTFDPSLADPRARTDAVADAVRVLRAEGALPAWRNETYAIAADFGLPPQFSIERGAARYFGLRTFAAHVNGLVRRGGGAAMWLARRSPDKAVDPGLLDNLVGGGVAAGFTVEQTLVKEAWEEAGIDEALARNSRPCGIMHVRRPMFDGLQRETLFIYDLDLPPGFVPANQDGEAVEHRLAQLAEVTRIVAETRGPDEVTIEASLVVLDCLIRHGAIREDVPGFDALAALLRRAP